MFTGIIQETGVITCAPTKQNSVLSVLLLKPLKKAKRGSSVAINGVCLTVTSIDQSTYSFDILSETFDCTNLGNLNVNDRVHVESSVCFGDEIGGHIVSGHVNTTAKIVKKEKSLSDVMITFSVDKKWMKYIIEKGFLSLDGCSLTVHHTNRVKSIFCVSLIPETQKMTLFTKKQKNEKVNIEIDVVTKTIVDTVQNLVNKRK